jgi:hypothetical protein
MFFILKFVISFTISFVILSFPISNDRPLFYYVHKISSPYTQQIFGEMKHYVEQSGRQTLLFAKQLFANADPGVAGRVRASAVAHGERDESLDHPTNISIQGQGEVEEYTPEEKELLKKILMQGH